MVRPLVTMVMLVACGAESPQPAAEPIARTTVAETRTTPTDASTDVPADVPADASTAALNDARTDDAMTPLTTPAAKPATKPATKLSPSRPARPARLDIADLGKPGEAVELVPVRGKITIFDFWAAWCKPCKALEPALVAIAREHADRVAIRRIDVVDSDSAAFARHLTPKGYSLPHVRVMDASGRVLLERSSNDLDALIEAIRAVVQRKPAP